MQKVKALLVPMCPAPQSLTGVSLYPTAHASRPTLEERLGVENNSKPMTPT